MKRRFYYICLFIGLLLVLNGCPDDGVTNNGSDKTVFEKSLTPSNTKIELTSGDGINITIPAGTLNSNLDIKVIKMANPPASTDSKLKVGSNVFKISLNGVLNFNDDIEIRIKYDKSKIQSGLTVLNGLIGIVYVNNSWQNVDCDFDIVKEEIVIKFNPHGKINKFNEKLQEENSVIFGDGYSTTDSGNQDNKLLGYLKQCKYIYAEADAYVKWSNGESSYIFDGDGSGVDFFPYGIAEHPQNIVWTGNQIDVTAPYFFNEFGLYYHIYGEFNNDGTIKEMTFEFNDKYNWSAKLIIKDVPLDYTQYEGWVDYRIPFKNDTDRRKFVIDFRVTEPTVNGTRTISTIDWDTFNMYLTFKINP